MQDGRGFSTAETANMLDSAMPRARPDSPVETDFIPERDRIDDITPAALPATSSKYLLRFWLI
jgi:hypothetical protein